MVYGSKANKPPNSPDPKHKRRISLLNSDFKIISGIDNTRFKKVATHTLNSNQLSAGDDRRIHHGICKARDAINAANSRNQGAGILDNDYMAAFDFMVLTWVFKVLEAKGLDHQVIRRLKNMYENHLTVEVINNKQGRCFENKRWSIRLEKPEDIVLFRSRKCGGLGLMNIKYKALSLMIRNFLETALNPNFQVNQYHAALYSWHVDNK